MPTRSWRQPWGMNSPNFMGVLSVHARGIRDRSPCHPANPRAPVVASRPMCPYRAGVSICVVGTSYVGLSLAVLLAEHHDVVAYDIDERRIEMLRERRSPISDPGIEERLATHDLRLRVTSDKHEAYAGAEFVVVATPTNYDERTNYFDTAASSRSSATSSRSTPTPPSVIKSTVPVGLHRGAARAPRHRRHRLLAGVPARGPGPARQPAPVADHRRRPRARAAQRFADLLAEARARRRRTGAAHRQHRGRGDQALRQHLPRDAGGLLQRARHLRR